jgi:hypothetical protein
MSRKHMGVRLIGVANKTLYFETLVGLYYLLLGVYSGLQKLCKPLYEYEWKEAGSIYYAYATCTCRWFPWGTPGLASLRYRK